MIESESNIEFEFPDNYKVIKFDSTDFYRNNFNALPGGKGVDFIASSTKQYFMIEVKNCYGHEADNRWRIGVDNSKRDKMPVSHDISDRDSLDIEAPQKVAMTIASLFGAFTSPVPLARCAECIPLSNELFCNDFRTGTKKLFVLLILDGNFGNGIQTRTNAMIHKRIQDSMIKKLKWLRCTVLVVSSDSLSEGSIPITARRKT